ncbi:MAG: serine hydrolase [Patescibacteria group bacterium]
MRDNFPKFALVGTMILVTMFLNHQSRGEFENLPGEKIILGPKLAALEFVTIPTPTSSIQILPLVPESTSSLDIESILNGGGSDSVVGSDSKKTAETVAGSDSKKAILEKQEKGIVMPVVDVAAAAVLDLETGTPYFNYKEKNQWPMASLTKLMTAVVAMNKMSLTQEVTIKEGDLKFFEGIGAKLKVDEKYVLSDLIKVMLVVSSNEAAEAIASTYGRDGFIKAMNDQAKDWGFDDTNFNDPTGISVSDQSTASDLYKLTREIYNEFPNLFKITRLTKLSVKEVESQKMVRFTNINTFAGRADFLGGKTGFTDEAQGNLISIFSLGDRPIAVIVLGTTDRFNESERLWQWFKSNYGR